MVLGRLVVWIPIGSPYARDCYLGVSPESQTTNPNYLLTISWLVQPRREKQELLPKDRFLSTRKATLPTLKNKNENNPKLMKSNTKHKPNRTQTKPKPNPHQTNMLILRRFFSSTIFSIAPFQASKLVNFGPRQPQHLPNKHNDSSQLLANQAAMYKDWVG